MKRTLALKAERLVQLTAEELHEVAGAEATPLCVGTLDCPTRPRTICGCLTGNYSLPC